MIDSKLSKGSKSLSFQRASKKSWGTDRSKGASVGMFVDSS